MYENEKRKVIKQQEQHNTTTLNMLTTSGFAMGELTFMSLNTQRLSARIHICVFVLQHLVCSLSPSQSSFQRLKKSELVYHLYKVPQISVEYFCFEWLVGVHSGLWI